MSGAQAFQRWFAGCVSHGIPVDTFIEKIDSFVRKKIFSGVGKYRETFFDNSEIDETVSKALNFLLMNTFFNCLVN